jgi:hypothetical protein
MASCSTVGTTGDRQTLVGRWRSTDDQHVAEYTFLANGTFTGYVASEESVLSQFTGKWVLRDGLIRYEYTADRKGQIPPGTRDRDRVVQIKRDHFVIQSADGHIRRYVRVGEG